MSPDRTRRVITGIAAQAAASWPWQGQRQRVIRGSVATVACIAAGLALAAPALGVPPAPSGLLQLPDPDECLWSGFVGDPDCQAVTGFQFPDDNMVDGDSGNPNQGVVSPDGKHVYVPVGMILDKVPNPDIESSAILAFERSTTGPDFGKLTPLAAPNNCIARDQDGSAAAFAPDATGCSTMNPNGGQAGAITQIYALAISPDGENVYAVARSANSVLIFDRHTANDADFGKLTFSGCMSHAGMAGCGFSSGPIGPVDVAVSEDGRNVYVVGDGGPLTGALATFERNVNPGPNLGDLTSVQCKTEDTFPNAAGCAPTEHGISGARAIAISPDDKTVYVGSYGGGGFGAVAAFSRDTTNNMPFGELTQIAGTPGCVSQTGFDHPGGAPGACTDGAGLGQVYGLAVSPEGTHVYATGKDTDSVAILDRDLAPATLGGLSQDAPPNGCLSDDPDGAGGNPPTDPACAPGRALNDAIGVVISSDGLSAYTVASNLISNGNAIAVFDRSPDGALTQLSGVDGCLGQVGFSPGCNPAQGLTSVQELWMSPDDRNLYTGAFVSRAIGEFFRAAPGTPPPGTPPDDTPPDDTPPPDNPQAFCKGKLATIVGTEASETIKGTPKADVIAALGGRDTVRAGGGNDTVCGGAGRDRLLGQRGRHRLLGEGGGDDLSGGAGRDRLLGGKGRDGCNGGASRDLGRACERGPDA